MTITNKKLDIKIEHWDYTCGDGCCTTYGTSVTINGAELQNQNQDIPTILEKVLEHLGYEVEIEETFEDEN